jgi:hypothetical protein
MYKCSWISWGVAELRGFDVCKWGVAYLSGYRACLPQERVTPGSLICRASSLSNSYERSSVQKRSCTFNEELLLNVNINIKVYVCILLAFLRVLTDARF